MAHTTARVTNGLLYRHGAANPIRLGTAEWDDWLDSTHTRCFYFKNGGDSLTARKERKQRGGAYWVAYRRIEGQLNKRYLGTATALTPAKLADTARRLNPFRIGQTPSEILAEAIDRYQPSHVFALFSGGHDSLCATYIASQNQRFSGCIHIHTGIGIHETRTFVHQVCRSYGWPLSEYQPPVMYEELVAQHGFPGPAGHGLMYQRLKERCLRQVLRAYRDPADRRRKIVFVSGCRRQESRRRMGNVKGAIITGVKNPSPRVVWVNPILNYTAEDKRRYLRENSLPRNPVVETLCMSGECLCGAFAQPGELELIRAFYPDVAAGIDRLAQQAKAAGKPHVWGSRPEQKTPAKADLPLCHSCQAKQSAAHV